MGAKKQIPVSIGVLINRLLPNAKAYDSEPAPGWKRWSRPENSEPIDDAVATLISRRRAPKLKSKAALALAGVTCPFWYARADVVIAVEAAIQTANMAEENRRLAKQTTFEFLGNLARTQNPVVSKAAAKRSHQPRSAKALDTLIKSTGSIIEHLEMVALLQRPLDAAVKTNPVSLHARAQFRDDKLFEAYDRSWNKFLDHADRLIEALVDIREVARAGLSGARNNPPAYFQRTFLENTAQSFKALTGAPPAALFFVILSQPPGLRPSRICLRPLGIVLFEICGPLTDLDAVLAAGRSFVVVAHEFIGRLKAYIDARSIQTDLIHGRFRDNRAQARERQ